MAVSAILAPNTELNREDTVQMTVQPGPIWTQD